MTSSTPPVLALPGASTDLTSRLQAGLEQVEALIVERTRSEDDFITEANLHLAKAGGKRFRPMLTMLVAELGEGINDRVIAAAAGVELTHLASLYHDDVMDEADLRRGAPSANARYDNSTAILVGDLLFGTASDIIADLGADAVKIQAQTFIRLCSGQIRDDRPCPDGTDPREYYRGVLADKTGEKVGVAFQLADDLIDIASESGETGKTPGTDLREGKRTLPVLNALASTDPADAELQELLRSELKEPERVERALELLRPHPAMAQAREETLAVGRRATDSLAGLPESDAKTALVALMEGVVHRVG